MLNKESGLLGISEVSNDCREVEEAAAAGNKNAQLALDVFAYRLAKYIASYVVPLGRLDALVFTGGIVITSSTKPLAMVINTNEELMIAQDTARIVGA